jgi:hypothetical protein
MNKFNDGTYFGISKLWAQNISLSAIIIFAIQINRTSKSEVWDRAIFISIIALSILLFLKLLARNVKEPKSYSLLVLAVPLLLLGIFGIEIHGTETTRGVDVSGLLWLGFGPWILVVTLFLIPYIFSIYEWRTLPRIARYVLSFIAFFIMVALIPAVWQGGASIIDIDSSEYVLNENLAVSAGQLPYVDFIPQYGTLFSWLIAPFKSILSPNGLVTLSLYMMSLATILAIMIGVYLVYRGTNKLSLTLSILIVVPITSIAQFPNREVFSGTIYSLLSQVPIRLFWILCIFPILLSLLLAGKYLKLKGFIAGLLSGAAIWINQDFALIGGVLAILFVCILSKNIYVILLAVLGFAAGVLQYPLFIQISGNTVQLKYIGFFVTQYRDGFMAEPIITPGPVLIILPLIATIAAISTGLLIRERFFAYQVAGHLKRALITSSFFSLWSGAGFAYYLNRSYASGQMQILFLPLSIALGNFLYLIIQLDGKNIWTVKSFFTRQRWRKYHFYQNMSYLILSITMALPIASTIAFPNPRLELTRLSQSVKNHTWPKDNSLSVIDDISNIKKNGYFSISEASFFGASANYIKLSTGIPSVNILNSPWDIPVTLTTIETGCKPIIESTSRFLILGAEAPALFGFENQSLCNVYKFVEFSELGTFRVAERIPNN